MAINVDVLGNTQPLEAAVQSAVNRIRRRPIKITVDDKGATQPLGNMRRSADEFSKSMEAANARIIAFGASMAIINGVADAFKGMVRNVVEVEKALADINVVMGLSAQNLERFSDGLFTVAKETGQAFKIAADAATEYARQGLSMEESLKRTKDALILTRLTGMDSANAVKSLTAAMNTYGNQIKDTTQLVSKFAAVDVKFAVSAEDFADAIARTGAAAKGAGVDIDELIGLVTAAQQQTARGGKVIGNSFKTIFTRIGRTDTLNQLENLGIAVRDIEGNTLGAKRILTDLANTFDSLTEAQKAQIAQTVGGVFQINVLKAVLGDAAKQNGILANATQISAGATDEAITKNEQLRQTMAAMATETGLAIKEVSAKIGEIALAPGMEKILNVVKSVAEGANNLLGDGESAGNKFANGFLKGLGNIITGPGLVVIVAVFGKLFLKAAQYARESLASLIGVTTEAQKQKAIQTSLVNLFGQNAALSKEMLRTDISRTEKEKIILALLKAQVAEANVLNAVSKQAASTLYRQGFGANLAPRRGRADGHIPNFAEREQAAKGGYAAGNIREMNMPGQGSVIYNSAEKVKNFAGMKQPAIMPPLSSKAGKNYQQAFGSVHGFDPYASSGFVPNFNKPTQKISTAQAPIPLSVSTINLTEGVKHLGVLFGHGGEGVTEQPYSQDFQTLSPGIQKYKSTTGPNASAASTLVRLIALKAVDMSGHEQFKEQFRKQNRGKKPGPNDLLQSLYRSLYKRNPKIQATLPSKAIAPVTTTDVETGKQLSAKVVDEEGEKRLKALLQTPLDTAMKTIASGVAAPFLKEAGDVKLGKIFTDNSKETKANDVIGILAEMAIRGALEAVSVSAGKGGKSEGGGKSGASFDFTGHHAEQISRFFKAPYAGVLKAIEMKLRGSTAQGPSGGIPRKVINKFREERGMADGYIPNFANPLADAVNREKGAGVPVSQIRVGSHQALMNKGNPLGLGVTNTTDEPNGLRDVFGANGYVPNYVNPLSFLKDKIVQTNFAKQMTLGSSNLEDFNKKLKKHKKAQQQHSAAVSKIEKQLKSNLLSQKEIDRLNRQLATAKKHEAAASRKIASTTRGTGVGGFLGRSSARMGRAFSGNAGMMMMMGAPMAAGFLQGDGPGQTGSGAAAYAAGGALTGAASGGMMASMVAPFFGPAAPLVIGVGALGGALHGMTSAAEENTKALQEKAKIESKYISNNITSNDDVMQTLNKAYKMGEVKEFSDQEVRDRLSTVIPTSFVGTTEERKPINKIIDYMRTREAPSGPSIGFIDKDEEAALLSAAKAQYPSFNLKQNKYDDMNVRKFADELERAAMVDQKTIMEKENFANIFRRLPGDQKIASKNLLDSTDESVKLFSGQEYANMIQGLSVDEFKKAKSDVERQRELADEANKKAAKEQAQGFIIQLDLQKTQIKAQQAAAIKQLEIKDRYSEISDNLQNQVKLAGSLATDQFKAQNKYLQALNKAEQAYAQSAETADTQLRMGILSGIQKDQSIQSVFKTSLGLKDGASFQDITDKVGSLSGKELKDKLQEIATNNKTEGPIRQAILDFLDLEILKRDNILNLAEKQQTSSKTQAEREKNINMILADRKTILDDLKRADRMADEDTRSAQKIRGFNDSVAKARRLNAVGAGFQSAKDKERFQILEKEFELESKLATLEENKADTLRELNIKRTKNEQEGVDNLAELESLYNSQSRSKEDMERMHILEGMEVQRIDNLVEIENQIKNANTENEKEIESLKIKLALEKERIKQDRLERTGPGSFGRGFDKGMGKMKERIEYMDYELAESLPQKFADGLAGAMTEAANGAKSIGDALEDAALNFLSYMQQAMMQKLAMQAVGALGFSQGGGVRKYSSGGNVPAMVTNGEYVMGREAVKKYGGGFMHSLNARGKIPNYSMGGDTMQEYGMGKIPKYTMGGDTMQEYGMGKIPKYTMGGDTMQEYGMGKIPYMSRGGEPGSALAANFGGGESFVSGRNYQSRAMSGFFYSGQAGNVGLQEDTQEFKGILQKREEERRRREMERQAKKAKRRKILGMIGSIATSYVLGSVFSGGDTGGKMGLGADTIKRMPEEAFNFQAPTEFDSMVNRLGFNPYSQSRGGKINKYAAGGMIYGKSGIDQIPAMLSEGEYVIKASSARQMGKPMLDKINAGKFYEGGTVGSEEQKASVSSGLTNNINISVNIDKNGNVQQDSGQTSEDGASSDSDQFAGQKISERIKTEVVSVLMEEKRPGGILSE